MKKEEHKKRHKEMHEQLDELVADYVNHHDARLSEITVMDLIVWSSGQIDNPTEVLENEKK